MAQATEVWFVDIPRWGWAVAVIATVVVGYLVWLWWRDWRMFSGVDYPEESNSEIVVPYYAEHDSLQALASDLKLDVPTARQVTKSKRLSIGFKGNIGEGGQSETAEFSGSMPLARLAKALEVARYAGNNAVTDISDAPMVSDEGVLSGAIEQIQADFPATSETSVLLSRVQEVFGNERVEAMAGKKREELEEIAKRNQLMIVRGQFDLAEHGGGEGGGPTLKLTHFNPTPAYLAANARAQGEEEVKADLVPIPEGVGLHMALPDATALTPAGRERLYRGQSVYLGIIAHSPSFDGETGFLTGSAWAVWGETMPNWEERIRGYSYYFGNGPGY